MADLTEFNALIDRERALRGKNGKTISFAEAERQIGLEPDGLKPSRSKGSIPRLETLDKISTWLRIPIEEMVLIVLGKEASSPTRLNLPEPRSGFPELDHVCTGILDGYELLVRTINEGNLPLAILAVDRIEERLNDAKNICVLRSNDELDRRG